MPAAVNQSNLFLSALFHTLCKQQSTRAVFSLVPALFFIPAAVNIAIFYSTLCFILCVSNSSQQNNLLLNALLYTLCQQQSILQSSTQPLALYFMPAAVNIAILYLAFCSILHASSSQYCNLLLSLLLCHRSTFCQSVI